MDGIDQALDAAYEYLNKECNSKGSVHKDSHQSSNLKVPRIELPKFGGDVLKFQNCGISLKLQCMTMMICPMFKSSLTYVQC